MDNIETHPIDETYLRAMEFMKNMKDNRQGIGNIYVIKKFDKNGNQIDEKFCKNMLTDYGMSHFFISGEAFPNNLYIGNGDGTFNHTTNTLISPITTTAATYDSSNTGRSYAYPLYYDNISGLITCVCRFLICKFPYTITGISDSVSITEYGIGTAYNQLWTHSWVYDIKGGLSRITKNPEEELEITVYFCMSYYEDLIKENWKNGRYTLITTMQRFFNYMKPSGIYRYKRGNKGCTVGTNTTTSKFENNLITRYTNIEQFTMSNAYTTNGDANTEDNANRPNGYFDGFCDWHQGFMSIERETIDTPEEFTAIVKPNNPNEYCLADRIGQQNVDGVPVSQCAISKVSMYNFKTHAWDNDESYTNDDSKWYTETPLQTFFATPLYYSNNNTIQTVYVYQNLKQNDPITAFDINLETVYACEKYWDVTTWHLLTNISTVPITDKNSYGHVLECRTAPYYITTHNDVSLTPYRASKGLIINPTDGSSKKYNFPMTTTIMSSVCDNYEYGWYKWRDQVYVPDITKCYSMGNTENESMTYKQWLCIFQSENNKIRFADMSDLSTAPTLNELPLAYSKNTNMFTQCYRSESNTGYITLQSTTCNESYLLNLKGDNIISTKYDTTKMCCVWGENQIAYIEANDSGKIKVYDFDTNTVIQTFDIPSGYTVSFLFGHHNYVWMVSTSSSTSTYFCNIATGEMKTCSSVMSNYTSNQAYVKMTCVDEVFVIWRRDLKKSSYAIYIRHDDPGMITSLSGMDEHDYGFSSYTLRYVHGNTLALLYSTQNSNSSPYGATNCVVDFGNWMDGNKTYKKDFDSNNAPNYIPYGPFFIINTNRREPIEHWMPHKIVGTTNSITAINNLKNIRNKQFYMTFCNIPEFNGLPPGVKQ